jgi:tetratricopeptide (TPR) repeat protein
MVRSSLTSWKFDIPALALGLALGAVAAMPALAAGDGGSSTPPPPTCAKGQVYDAKKKSCIKAERGVLPDEQMTRYAYALARSDRFEEALAILDMLENPNTAKALNYRGYATRKLGRTDEGIGYYLKSVSLDPNYAQVREYLGEAYVIQGKIDLAKQQLATIKTICGSDCEEYEDLAVAIADSKL